ncbi:MAG: hypothetical protein CVV27_17240, partial [Candidatus Melainabacteria bacterium HGW-Melainabacteria-1]
MNTGKASMYVIGIGASAGGLEAILSVLGRLTSLERAAVVVAQHLSPHHKSALPQLLAQQISLPVLEADNDQAIEPGHIYVVPQDCDISLHKGQFHLHHSLDAPGPKPSIDTLFETIALEKGNYALGVLLSGSGSDGAAGLAAIQRAGGRTLVQDPDTAGFEAMPQAAIRLGSADQVLAPEALGQRLQELIQGEPKPNGSGIDSAQFQALHAIFSRLSEHTGTDFINYKPSTLYRRLQKRLNHLSLNEASGYLSYLETHPEELDELFRTVVIGVTGFYRDPEAFVRLSEQLKELLAPKLPADPIRVWVPGCASGEEAYTLAFIMIDLLGEAWSGYNLQIFASDLDEQAISFARQGIYPRSALNGLSEELLQRFFEPRADDCFEVNKQIRARILFTRHDLTSNPPFMRLDLISCRNLLIYFNPVLQKQLLPIFHYALKPQGLLFLGKSESVSEYSDLFEALDTEAKIFRRKRGNKLRTIHFSAFRPQRQSSLELPQTRRNQEASIGDLVKETLFTSFEHPYVVINESLDIQEIFGDVRLYLGLSQGQLNPHILRLINEELQMDLMSTITRAVRDQSAIRSHICRFGFYGSTHFVRFSVKPLIIHDKGQELYLVIFEAIDPQESFSPLTLEATSDGENVQHAALQHELATIKTQLQNYIEELETSNEELQALNEELQSTNEELQSSNEELETSNEELQSTFEEVQVAYLELQTSNRKLEDSRRQLRQAEAQVRALLDNTQQGFLLLDHQGQVITHNHEAERILGLISSQPLRPQQNFRQLLPAEYCEPFNSQFGQALAGKSISGETAVSCADGRQTWLAYTYSLINEPEIGLQAVSLALLDISSRVEAQERLRAQDLRFRALIEHSYEGLAITELSGVFRFVSPSVERMLGYPATELIGQALGEFVHPRELTAVKRLIESLAA